MADDRSLDQAVHITRDTLLAIERAAVLAWPALETAAIDGWLWRHSGGGSQRANSVSALDFTGNDPEAAIDDIERRYRACGAAPMFQICDVNTPRDLDQRLHRRGYRLKEPCTCLAKAVSASAIPAGVEAADRPSEDWLAVYLAGITESRRGLAPQILARVPAPSAFLLARDEGRPVATALAFVAEGVVIAECVMTTADRRRSGAATRVMRALEAWGVRQGAKVAALQAVAANAPAQGLYAKLDYERVGGYHYRVLDR